MDKHYNLTYEPVRQWFLAKGYRLKVLTIVYKAIPLMIAAAYTGLCAGLILCRDMRAVKVVLIPCAIFCITSLFRKKINRPRPYEGDEAVVPLIHKDKQGQSFPSRHALSASVIAVAFFSINYIAGLVMMAASLVVAITRVLAGVHYPSDVIAALLIGYIVCGAAFII